MMETKIEVNPQFRGQWGGKISNGEEMWWSEPQTRLSRSFWARLRFRLDVRHHFILKFWKKIPAQSASLQIADFGCGTGGTTLNFSQALGQPIIGLDIFPTQLQIATQFAQAQNSACTFKQIAQDGTFPLSNGSLDAILSMDVLGHVPHIPAVLNQFARVLKTEGSVLLFTESTYSQGDRSIMAQLAARGADMMQAVPEHISLFPKERLEEMFRDAGFEVRERYSANVGHFFFFPKDYVLMLKGRPQFRAIYWLALVWNRVTKISPFYPLPLDLLRLGATYLWGRNGNGTSYFYHLIKR